MTQVMTVTGPVDASELGLVLPHEHLIVNTVGEYRGNGLINDESLVIEELKGFRDAGGGTLVELSLVEIGRDPAALERISEATGVTVVMGCGHYRDPYLDRDYFDRSSVDDIADDLVDEIENGVGDTGVRPGIIGEIGADKWYVSAAEERSFRAAARAHLRTGLTITTHAARWPVGRPQLELLVAEGVDPRRVIMGHCDTVPDMGYHVELAAAGCYVEIDTIGTGTEYDLRREVDYILNLIEQGHERQILLSHDIFLRSHMTADGGCGYAYLITDFLPRLRAAGIGDELIELFTVENPRAALTGERVEAAA